VTLPAYVMDPNENSGTEGSVVQCARRWTLKIPQTAKPLWRVSRLLAKF